MMNRRTLGLLVSLCVLLVLMTTHCCPAQTGAAASPTSDCVADPQLPAFEVAAVTPLDPKSSAMTNIGPYGLPQFDITGASLSLLVSFAYGVQPDNFINAPHGLDNARFDVHVKSADDVSLSYEALKPRMQQMLQQRFCLKARAGSKDVRGYALVVAKGGAKVSPLDQSGERGSGYIMPNEVNFTRTNFGAFAGALTSAAGRPVADHTGLPGVYNLRVKFAPPSDAQSELPSVFTALKEQLGLELKPAQVPVPTLTIERLKLTPSEN
jgi:uncharacterized protein (TIGR03435 family)